MPMAREPAIERPRNAARLAAEARALVAGPAPGDAVSRPSAGAGSDDGVIELYERLRARLEAVDARKIEALLDSLGREVDRLSALSRDIERLRRLRRAVAP